MESIKNRCTNIHLLLILAVLCFLYIMVFNPKILFAQEGKSAYESEPWVRTGGPIGGLGYDIRFNFDNLNMWYVTDAKSGFHMSTDNGINWFVSNQGVTSPTVGGEHIPVFCATVDPINPNIVWIGTQYAGGIFKSTDYGYTWVKKTKGTHQEIAPALSFRGFTIDPENSDIVYAMAEVSSHGWTSDGTSRIGVGGDKVKGVVYKTTDGGENWQQIWWGNNLCRYCWIDPRNTDVLYVSTGIFDRDASDEDIQAKDPGGVGIIKSTDGGKTWEVFDQDNGLMNLFVGTLYMNPNNPDVLLAGTGSNYAGTLVEEQHDGVYLTENGGENWTQVLSAETFGAVEFYDPDPSIAYAISDMAVYRSEDGGYNWQRFNRSDGRWGPPGIVAGMPIDLQVDPRDPNRVFVNNYLGGNFLSEDGGQTWVLASKGYTGAQMTAIAVAPGQSAKVYSGARSGVFRSDNGGSDWIGIANSSAEFAGSLFNEITALVVDPTDGNHVLVSGVDIMGLAYTKNGGQSWQQVNMSCNPFSFIYAPSDPKIVYASALPLYCFNKIELSGRCDTLDCDLETIHLYVSSDGGDTWTIAGQQDSGMAIVAMTVHPNDPNTIFASRPNADLIKSTDGGKNWKSFDASGLPSMAPVCLVIDPMNPNIIFAGFVNDGGLYRSTDAGDNWTQMCSGLNPESNILSIVFDPMNSQVIYAGERESGVYVSTDGGDNWQAITEGMTHRLVKVLSISDDGTVLYAGVDGNGVYRLGEPSATSVKRIPKKMPVQFILEQNSPNPFNASTEIRYELHQGIHIYLRIYDLLGKEIITLVNQYQESGNHSVHWNGLDENGKNVSSGIYLCCLETREGKINIKKMILLK